MAVSLMKGDNSEHYIRRAKSHSQPVGKTKINTLIHQYALHDFTRTVLSDLADVAAMQTADTKSTSWKTMVPWMVRVNLKNWHSTSTEQFEKVHKTLRKS